MTNSNQIFKCVDDLTMHVLLSCLDDADKREATLLFEYKPQGYDGLRFTLRALPCLRPLQGGPGHELAFEFELTGIDKGTKESHGGVGLGTDIPIAPEVVASALAGNRNPIIEILTRQQDIAKEFQCGSTATKALIESWDIGAEIQDPGQVNGMPGDNGRL